MEAADEKPNMPPIVNQMIDFIVKENKAHFRSQQINDPEMTESEKTEICEKLLNESHTKFLYRFGKFLKEEHLMYFEDNIIDKTSAARDADEIKFLLADLRNKLKNRARDVRNRRFAALQKMRDTSTYFSEKEMMEREPLLYDHLIGQYMTENEKRFRDDVDPEIQFSGVLLEGIAKKHIDELRQKQKYDESQLEDKSDNGTDDEDSENDSTEKDDNVHKDGIINDAYYPQTPPSFRQHWGDFETDEESTKSIKTTETKVATIKTSTKKTAKQNYITADEKDLLREEFIGIMHSNFLSGNDKEFDYATVDDNCDFDNILIQNQDEEDKYFECDDNYFDDGNEEYIENPLNAQQAINIENEVKVNTANESGDEDEEDELDVYMKQINKL